MGEETRRQGEGGPKRRRGRLATALLAALAPTLAFAWSLQAPAGEEAQPGRYVGREVCAQCHEDRAEQHWDSNFFASWKPAGRLGALRFDSEVQEGEVQYAITRGGEGWNFEVQLPGRPRQSFPVHSLVGGERFGHSLLVEMVRIEGRPLPRPTLVEARFFIEAETGKLKLSPGFPRQPPLDYETAVGRVLSPDFTEKCLDCHGGVRDRELAARGGPHPVFVDTGVGCERCHGPGGAHLEALEGEGDGLGIVNPARLSHPEAMQLCGACHSGFSSVSHPRPEDLLISNQVNALSRSQCYLQSEAAFSCISCHDPHRNARHDEPVYNDTCRSCHARARPDTVLCSRQPQGDCVACHMPVVDRPGNFRLRDHWIRVVGESPAHPAAHGAEEGR